MQTIKITSIRIPAKLHKRWKLTAYLTDFTMDEIVGSALENELNQPKYNIPAQASELRKIMEDQAV